MARGGVWRFWLRAGAGVALLLALAANAAAQAVVTVSEDVNFRLGVLGQFQADWLEGAGTGDAPNLFVRRVRLLVGGQVAKNVSFFVETDAPNLGKKLPDGKSINPQLVVQDAYGEVRLRSWLVVDAGLMLVPFSRNSVQSAATLLPIDYGAYSFAQSTPTQCTAGRDTGIQARGHFLGNRLEYRVGAFQGAHRPGLDPSARLIGRAQYHFLETEGTGYFYAGTHLGTKRVAALGAGFDVQDDYGAYNVDFFLDQPLGPGSLTTQIAYNHFDGGATLPTLPDQHVVLLEAGYFLPRLKLMPVLQFTRRDGRTRTIADETRWSAGVNYWWRRHNANVKAAYGRIDGAGGTPRDEFTVQMQLFYF